MSKATFQDDFPASQWLELLKESKTGDRQWKKAVNALSAMGLRVVPALIEATGNDHPEVRQGVSKALHKIGPAIIPFLMKALRHDNPTVVNASVKVQRVPG